MDAAALILRHPDLRERGRELALAYRVGDRLDLWLDDRRLQAEARESAEEELAGKAAKGQGRKRVRGARRG
jgi:hypothetical protein